MDNGRNKRTTADRSPPNSSMPAAKQARFHSPPSVRGPDAPPDTMRPVASQDLPAPGQTVSPGMPHTAFPPPYSPATYSHSGVVHDSTPGTLSWNLNVWFMGAGPSETRLGYSLLLQQMITALRALPGLNLAPSSYFLHSDATALSSILENDPAFEREVSRLHHFIATHHADGLAVTESIRRILNHVCHHVPGNDTEPHVSPQVVRKAWEAPFVGTADVRLLQALRSSFEKGPRKGAAYSNNVSMLQSSGTGKTRSANEISHLIFTFAAVLREDTRAGEFPAADSSVRDLLTGPSDTLLPPQLLYPGRCRRFLEALFASATRWLQGQRWTQTTQPLAYLEKTNGWKIFFDAEREAIYDAVVGVVKELELKVRKEEEAAKTLFDSQRATGLEQGEAQRLYEESLKAIHLDWVEDGSDAAREALLRLRQELEVADPARPIPPQHKEKNVPPLFQTSVLSESQLSAANTAAEGALNRWTDNDWPEGITVSPSDLSPAGSKLTVLFYFDEAHTLCTGAQGPHTKTHYDHLLSVLHDMLKDIMGLFLSTSSRLRQLAPHAALSASARQAQSTLLQPPLTELPFDCKAATVAENVPTLAEVSSIRFLANFGRPLFWSVFPEYDSMDDMQKSDVEDFIVQLTEAKLINLPPGDPDMRWDRVGMNAEIAVIDVRIWIDYEPRKSTADGTEADLVATHLRLVFTVPLNREYFYSGYASEPMLAEAAARLMRRWMWDGPTAWNPAHTLSHLLARGLLDRGERGELVARFLLTLAYDNAVRYCGEICSVGCTLSAFFNALFRDKFAQQVLAAKPDNVVRQNGNAKTLGDLLGESIVRFTHFAKLDDESGITTRGLCAAFIRGAAFIGQQCQAHVDAIVPILLDPKKPITPENMSAVLVSIKLRVRAGGPSEYDFTAEQLGLFEDSDPKQRTHALRKRPYVTLLMELGVKVQSSARQAGSKGKKTARPATSRRKTALQPQSPSNLVVAEGPTRRSTRKPGKKPVKKPEHPRFNIRAYGCSSTVYRVIDEADNSIYSSILLANTDWEDDHPRPALRDCVSRMLPTWSADNAYGWVKDRPMRDADRVPGTKERVDTAENPSDWTDASDDDDDDGDADDDGGGDGDDDGDGDADDA